MSKVLSGEESAVFQRWQAPSVEKASGQTDNPSQQTPLTAEEIERIQKQAYDEAYEQGLKEGRAKGEQEIKQQVKRLEQLMGTLSEPLAQLDETVEQELLNLTLTIAGHLVRREIKTEPGQVVAVIREALAALPLNQRNMRVHLHPDDAATVRRLLAEAEGERAWEIVEDPVLSRGGCRVASETSQIDATVEKRLAAIAAQLLGGEREDDHDSV